MRILMLLLFIVSTSGYAQTTKQTPEQKFQRDLENDKIQLYFIGGIASRVTDKDAKFVANYHIAYHDFGCTPPPSLSDYAAYNVHVLNHLAEKFGNDWEKDIRKDILGWEKWKEKQTQKL